MKSDDPSGLVQRSIITSSMVFGVRSVALFREILKPYHKTGWVDRFTRPNDPRFPSHTHQLPLRRFTAPPSMICDLGPKVSAAVGQSNVGITRNDALVEVNICKPTRPRLRIFCPRLKRAAREAKYSDQTGYDAIIHELASVNMLVPLAHTAALQVC